MLSSAHDQTDDDQEEESETGDNSITDQGPLKRIKANEDEGEANDYDHDDQASESTGEAEMSDDDDGGDFLHVHNYNYSERTEEISAFRTHVAKLVKYFDGKTYQSTLPGTESGKAKRIQIKFTSMPINMVLSWNPTFFPTHISCIVGDYPLYEEIFHALFATRNCRYVKTLSLLIPSKYCERYDFELPGI